MTCPICGKTIKAIQFGYGYVVHCCNTLLYSGKDYPEQVDLRGMLYTKPNATQ